MSYYINWRSSQKGIPLRDRVFKQVDTIEKSGYVYRVFRFLDRVVNTGYVEVEVREDMFKEMVKTGDVVEFLLEGGRDSAN